MRGKVAQRIPVHGKLHWPEVNAERSTPGAPRGGPRREKLPSPTVNGQRKKKGLAKLSLGAFQSEERKKGAAETGG